MHFRAQLITRSPGPNNTEIDDVVRDFDWELTQDALVMGKPSEKTMLVRVSAPRVNAPQASTASTPG